MFTQTQAGQKYTCAHQALTQAYKALNYDLEFMTLPGKRALHIANSGTVDGEMLRIKGIEEKFPNLIPIPVVLCTNETIIIANKPVEGKTLSELSEYSFGITAGFIQQERIAAEYNLTAVRSARYEILVDMLLRNRVDMVFMVRQDAERMILNYPDIPLNIVKGISRKTHFYHYLHNQHKELVPRITAQLQQMQAQGKINTTDIQVVDL